VRDTVAIPIVPVATEMLRCTHPILPGHTTKVAVGPVRRLQQPYAYAFRNVQACCRRGCSEDVKSGSIGRIKAS
jgi:hypothetical protein